MRNKLLAVLAAVALAVVLGVSSARADQIVVGDTNCSAIDVSISGTSISGSSFTCTEDAYFTSAGFPDIGSGNSTWTYNPDTGELSVSLDSGNDTIDGYVSWTYNGGLAPGGQGSLYGNFTVSGTPTGFYGEYVDGGTYNVDLTFSNCSGEQTGTWVYRCADVSSGEIPVPEPGTLSLLGTGLLTMAGFLRRKLSA
jgi:PEP-CTERM motif